MHRLLSQVPQSQASCWDCSSSRLLSFPSLRLSIQLDAEGAMVTEEESGMGGNETRGGDEALALEDKRVSGEHEWVVLMMRCFAHCMCT